MSGGRRVARETFDVTLSVQTAGAQRDLAGRGGSVRGVQQRTIQNRPMRQTDDFAVSRVTGRGEALVDPGGSAPLPVAESQAAARGNSDRCQARVGAR